MVMKKFLAAILLLSLSTAFAQYVEDKDFSKVNIGNINTGKKQIVLTFDDGPNAGVTTKVLDILSDYEVKGSFFVIGKNAQANPMIMQRIVEEGHVVGNHSMTHQALKNLDPILWKDTVRKEVLDAHEAILPYMTNNRYYYYRAPEAAWNQKFADFLNEDPIGREYIGPILWDAGGAILMKNGKMVEAADWDCWAKKISVKDCFNGYVYEIKSHKGGVVLMHDLRKQSVELLAKLIPYFQDEGYTFVTLNDVEWRPEYLPRK
jgi:peptidoglycan/xylan/chitin deacetylase (PgdA/CDA1 family)